MIHIGVVTSSGRAVDRVVASEKIIYIGVVIFLGVGQLTVL